MEPRPLGATGILVSPVALGTVKLGRNTKVSYAEPFELPTDAEVERLLEGALELGVTTFDTAPAYGSSEDRLRGFVCRHRDEIVVCSKAGESFAGGVSSYDFSRAALEDSVERSLRRLGIDRLDVLLLHSDGRDLEILERTDAVETLGRLKAAGSIGATGISAHTAEGVALGSRLLDVVMAPFSQARPELGGELDRARAGGTGTMAIKVMSRGHLDVSPARALEFVLSQPQVDTLVLGTLSLAHLSEAVELAGGRRS